MVMLTVEANSSKILELSVELIIFVTYLMTIGLLYVLFERYCSLVFVLELFGFIWEFVELLELLGEVEFVEDVEFVEVEEFVEFIVDV